LQHLALALGALIWVTAANPAAAVQTYICRLSEYGATDWIPDILFIGHDPDDGSVFVSDPIILFFNGKPIRADIAADNPDRTTFVWSYAVRDSRGTRASRMIYRATWLKRKRRMSLTATPAGHDDRFAGSGRCFVEDR
jgi:hypothetical protein